MKKCIVFCTLIALSTLSYASTCPCPGPCCPYNEKTQELNLIADYLSPWATDEQTQDLIEVDLKNHKV